MLVENHQQIKVCEEAKITPYVPLTDRGAPSRNQGYFTHEEYTYRAQTDSYQCPAGKTLSRQGSQNKNGKIQYKYVSKASICKYSSMSNTDKIESRNCLSWMTVTGIPVVPPVLTSTQE